MKQLLSAFGHRNMIINPYRYAVSDPLLDGLIAWLPLNETSGTRFDAHTGGYDFTDNNTVGFAAGKVGNAASFVRGNAEYLSSTNSVFDLATVDYSILGWFRQTGGIGSSHAYFEHLNVSGLGGV